MKEEGGGSGRASGAGSRRLLAWTLGRSDLERRDFDGWRWSEQLEKRLAFFQQIERAAESVGGR
jgi:hypothetical protein